MLITNVEREFENESAAPPGIPKNASRVLKRFFRNYVATWRLQVEIRSLRSLTRAFERAASRNTSHHPCCHTQAPRQVVSGPGSTALRTVEKQKHILELQRRVSIHPVCDSSIMRDDEGSEIENSSDDSSSSCYEERVSVESVVHKLFLQVEDTKRQAEAKDARILELEALVVLLTSENCHLRHLLLDTKPQSMMTTATSHSCEARAKQIDNQGSNQLVMR